MILTLPNSKRVDAGKRLRKNRPPKKNPNSKSLQKTKRERKTRARARARARTRTRQTNSRIKRAKLKGVKRKRAKQNLLSLHPMILMALRYPLKPQRPLALKPALKWLRLEVAEKSHFHMTLKMSPTATLNSRTQSSRSHQCQPSPRSWMRLVLSSSNHTISTSIKLLLLWIRSFPDTPTRLVTTMPRFPQNQTISAITSSSLQNSARQPSEQRTPTFMYLSMWSYSQDGVYTSPLSLSSRFGCPQSS